MKKWENNGVTDVVIICVYVDDLTIAGSRLSAVLEVKAQLGQKFKMKDLGELHYILKMEVKRDMEKKILTLSEHKYVQNLLRKYNMKDAEPAQMQNLHLPLKHQQ